LLVSSSGQKRSIAARVGFAAVEIRNARSAPRLPDLVENGKDVAAKLRGVLAHREVTHVLHYGQFRAGNPGGRAHRVFGRAGEVVFPGEQIERAARRVDAGELAAQIGVDAVEVEGSGHP
jgi:hypothetical protein